MPIEPPLVYRLQRQTSSAVSTLGQVFRVATTGELVPLCHVCEDVVRERPGEPVSAWKIKGQTAIPQGRYRIIVTPSSRFQRDLPILVDVDGFTGIRIHPGNTHADTEGCLLPGLSASSGVVFQSKAACAVWQAEITTALLAGREVWIDIRNAKETA
jgi:hypothetical protein